MKIIKAAWQKIYGTYSSKQISASPQIFFLLFLYLLLYRNEQPLADTYLLSFFPLALYAGLRYNLIFMITDFIKLPSAYLAFFLFLLTLTLACNQKWKIFIFLFRLGYQLSRSPIYNSIYLTVAAGLFCHEIYHNLTCRTLNDNHKYFAGFFGLAAYGIVNFVSLSFTISFSQHGEVVMIAATVLYAHYLFRKRVEEISKLTIGQIKESRILAFFLRQFEEQAKTKYVKESKISIHKRTCTNIHCFCSRREAIHKQNFFIRQMYENAIKKFPQSCDTLLYQHYVDFLLRNQLVLSCLHFLQKWNHSSHYSLIAKLKCMDKAKLIFKDLNSANLYEKQYRYALEYDELLLNLTIQIYQILELKLNFWHETAKETPKMIIIQEEGLQIVDKMYSLNIYYNQVIKKYEKKLFCFDATILYAMYLLSTTNFKEYAELIIKNTSKVLQEIQVLQNNSSQTYAVKAKILQKGLYYIKDISPELQCLSPQNIKMNQKGQDCKFKIVIDNASHSFCKLVKINKEQLIGQQLGVLIPDGYKHVHKATLLKVLDFQREELADTVSSKYLHNSQKLPIKIGQNGLIMSYISIRTMVDLENGSSFISVVKKMDEKTIHAIITFKGDLQERDDGFNEQILMHSEFKKYLQIIVDRWNREKAIKEQRFNVMINSLNFCIIISSPLAKNFTENKQTLQRQGIYPPLHVQIVNESSTKNRGIHGNHDKLVKQFKHMQNAINHDSESTSSSKNSTAAINILSTFSQKNTAPTYRRIIIGFIFVITCCLIISMIGFLICKLEWDNTNINTNNPLNDTINFMKISHLSANIVLNLWDIQEYLVNPNLNQTEILAYSSTKYTYLKQAEHFMRNKFTQFKANLYNSLRNPSSILMEELRHRLETFVTFMNMSVIPSNYTFQQQSITFESLMMNYLVDLNLMSKGVYDNTLILPLSYSEAVINLQNATVFNQLIDASIEGSIKTSLTLAICMSILILILLIIMFFFLRSRLSMHEKIFDLFASIQSEMVIKQIRSLSYISNIIKNYGQSSDILKTNVMQYQQNAIYPKRGSSRKSSVTNQIVVGLQKFDIAQEISPREQISTILDARQTDRSAFRSKTKRQSHLTKYKQIRQYMDMKKTLEKRKRAGDLDFTDSQSDPNMRINKKHITIYIMTLVFVVFLTLEVVVTQNFGLQVKARKNSLATVFNTYTSNQFSFLLGKLYLRNGNAIFGTLDPRYGLVYLQSKVQTIPAYDFANSYGYDTLRKNCVTDRNGTMVSTKVCMYNYSYLTLLGQFGVVFKQLFQARYNADQNYNSYVANNQIDIYKQILTNISSKTFYLQTVDNQMQIIVYGIVDQIFNSLYDYTLTVNQLKASIFIASVCWWVVTAIVGISLILKMKQQYFKEVYMLTFLNSEMIINNKRVESFLDSINKSSTN